jgi:hypothetical protein
VLTQHLVGDDSRRLRRGCLLRVAGAVNERHRTFTSSLVFKDVLGKLANNSVQ